MRVLAFALALLFAAPASANTITIKGFWPGGVISTFVQFWETVADSGDDVAIDGACASACTFLLSYVPENRICVTGRASLGFHQTTSDNVPNPEMTSVYVRLFYPDWVMAFIKSHGGLKDDPIWMAPEDIVPHLRVCPGASVVPQDGFLAPPQPQLLGAQPRG